MSIVSVFSLIFLLPLIGILISTHVGLQAVSDALITAHEIQKRIVLHLPNGALYQSRPLTVSLPIQGIITQTFGESEFPYYLFHTGVDIAANIGTPVTAVMDGEVVRTDIQTWGLGTHVVIDHTDNLTSTYGHLSEIAVTPGQRIKRGEILGYSGNSGWSTGPHLHLEFRVFGIPINPNTILPY